MGAGGDLDPDHEEFDHLKYPPFVIEKDKLDMKEMSLHWGDLRIDGYIGGKGGPSKSLSGSGVDRKFALLPDDTALVADGADTTRVVLRVTDEFGATRTYANDPIVFTLEGPAELIGDNPFALIGGTGAVWIRAKETGRCGEADGDASAPGFTDGGDSDFGCSGDRWLGRLASSRWR